ncbi:hypothetical protein ACTWPT_32970 [Nonomuraea sp. 3N208]|uniref:hypothetical protein n=1 Tax=Nonomuraea sp. 3N208 TaxID=3457421 RepID=UPI003FD63B54
MVHNSHHAHVMAIPSRILRALTAVVLVATAVAVLWYVVLPLLEPLVTLDEVTTRK